MNHPKVLVGITIYEGKDYVWEKFYDNIKNFSYPNYQVLIVDNTSHKKYYQKLLKRTKNNPLVTVVHTERGGTSREAQARSLNIIRDECLRGGYDYFLSLESDLIPPRDIIERLISHDKPVVGCVYLIGYDYSDSQPPRPCLFGVKKNDEGGASTFNYPPEQGFSFFGRGVVPIHGCGIGVTLISRKILERFRFWYDLNPPIKHSDVLFYMDLHNNGIQNYVDTDMIIPHYNSAWDLVTDK